MSNYVQLSIGDSDAISVVGHDEDDQTLFITFRASNKRYAYKGISREQYNNIVSAESVGQAYNQLMRETPGLVGIPI